MVTINRLLYLFLVFLFLTSDLNASSLNFELEISTQNTKENNFLVVKVVNTGTQAVFFNTRMLTLASFEEVHELTLIIVNENDNIEPFTAKIMIGSGVPELTDYKLLQPGTVYVFEIPYGFLKECYSLQKGKKYKILALYKDQWSEYAFKNFQIPKQKIFTDEVESNWLSIVIE